MFFLIMFYNFTAKVVGPDKKVIITLDLDLFNNALEIQQSITNNWVLRAGEIHKLFAALHALGKTLDGSGIDTCSVDTGSYSTAALRGIKSGKAYKRGVEYYLTVALSISILK